MKSELSDAAKALLIQIIVADAINQDELLDEQYYDLIEKTQDEKDAAELHAVREKLKALDLKTKS